MNQKVLIYSTKQFVIFSAIGVLNTAIHYGVFVSLYRIFMINYLLSSGIGYCCGLVNSYFMNRAFTFKMKNKKNVSEATRFLTTNIVALAVNLLLMKIVVGALNIIPEVSQVLAIFGSMVTNFLGNKFWTFRIS